MCAAEIYTILIVFGYPSGRWQAPRSTIKKIVMHSTSPLHDKQTLKISWKSAKQIFQEKSSKNALKYGN